MEFRNDYGMPGSLGDTEQLLNSLTLLSGARASVERTREADNEGTRARGGRDPCQLGRKGRESLGDCGGVGLGLKLSSECMVRGPAR